MQYAEDEPINTRFKLLADIMKSDSRLDESLTDAATGLPGAPDPFRKWTLDLHYAVASGLELQRPVPRDVRVSWDTTRNLLLYAWFVYKFFDVARLQGSTTVELALKAVLSAQPDDGQPSLARIKKMVKSGKSPGLSALLREAVRLNLIIPKDFAARQRHLLGVERHNATQKTIRDAMPKEWGAGGFQDAIPESEERFIRRILYHISYLRNEFAHGTFALLGPCEKSLELMRDLIDGLFKKPDAQTSSA